MNDDWYDMLVALLQANARFLIVGAHALAVHGVPRGTQDLDIWIDSSAENTERIFNALETFGAPAAALGIKNDDLQRPDCVIQFGLPPNRIDLLTSISGIASFDSAWETRVVHRVREHAFPFIGRQSLLDNKRASGRRKDLADVEALGETP
ncbi:MAG: hypothetical protein H7Z40_22900 [Phycisphaerae bacterium]|nr:hypothetical protein [Gemmatimonadaceae bacterium]